MASVLWLPAHPGIPGKAQDRKMTIWIQTGPRRTGGFEKGWKCLSVRTFPGFSANTNPLQLASVLCAGTASQGARVAGDGPLGLGGWK